jgi:hypothetical protein
MARILATFALFAAAAFMALSSPASAASRSKSGAESDHAATAPTDISAHRRRVDRRYYYGAPHYGAYAYPYYAYGYHRPNPYREWYWGPRIFRYGPWW